MLAKLSFSANCDVSTGAAFFKSDFVAYQINLIQLLLCFEGGK